MPIAWYLEHMLTSTLLVLALLVAVPQAVGESAVTGRVDAVFSEWDRVGSPGCALGVIRDGELIYEAGYGFANLDWDIPIDTETVLYVGSVSKQFTAAAVALLVQEGRLSLDDDIRDYFPEMPGYERPITVRHLVHHTSGLRDIYTLMSLGGLRLEDVFSDAAAIDLIAAQRATNFAPGDEYLYSNSGYFLLAQLVGRVTGTSLREYAEEKIFKPLGMNDTHFHDNPNHVLKRRAMSYGRAGEDEFGISYLGNFDKVGAGGLYTTVRDLLLWDRNFYTSDVGGQELLDMIHTPGILSDGEVLSYAFGLQIGDYRGLATVSHGGSMMGFKAAFLQFPEQRFSVVSTCNLGNIEPMGLNRQVAEIYLGDQMAEPEGTGGRGGRGGRGAGRDAIMLSNDELAAYAGTYYSAELDVTYKLTVDERGLVLQMSNAADARLVPIGDDAFRGRWVLRFGRGADGSVESFTVNAGRVTNIRFERS